MKTRTIPAGTKYRRDYLGMLDEVSLQYTEHRTASGSTIVIQIETEAQEDAYNFFVIKWATFVAQLNVEKLQKQEKKLARKNRFRKLTFRKPLTTL